MYIDDVENKNYSGSGMWKPVYTRLNICDVIGEVLNTGAPVTYTSKVSTGLAFTNYELDGVSPDDLYLSLNEVRDAYFCKDQMDYMLSGGRYLYPNSPFINPVKYFMNVFFKSAFDKITEETGNFSNVGFKATQRIDLNMLDDYPKAAEFRINGEVVYTASTGYFYVSLDLCEVCYLFTESEVEYHVSFIKTGSFAYMDLNSSSEMPYDIFVVSSSGDYPNTIPQALFYTPDKATLRPIDIHPIEVVATGSDIPEVYEHIFDASKLEISTLDLRQLLWIYGNNIIEIEG